MKILIVMDPGILIPVTAYGGIERIVELLAKEYLRRGHEVHLLVTKGSNIPGCIIHPFGEEGFPPKKFQAFLAIPRAWKFLINNSSKYDLIHNFGRLLYLLPVLNTKVKKIMSYQREISKRNIAIVNMLPNKNMFFAGCSKDLVERNYLPGNWTSIHNCCDFNMYDLCNEVMINSPLIFLGRIERIKGCHTAIAVAKATNNQLIIAGNLSTLEKEKLYFEKEIKPLIDGEQIMYVGQVNDAKKNELLGKSKALLMPIEWNEPFGIVMIEAMACGTPVIAFKRGSVDEVIDENITGYKVQNQDEMEAAVYKIHLFERASCRKKAAERFDVKVIAQQYLKLF